MFVRFNDTRGKFVCGDRKLQKSGIQKLYNTSGHRIHMPHHLYQDFQRDVQMYRRDIQT